MMIVVLPILVMKNKYIMEQNILLMIWITVKTNLSHLIQKRKVGKRKQMMK